MGRRTGVSGALSIVKSRPVVAIPQSSTRPRASRSSLSRGPRQRHQGRLWLIRLWRLLVFSGGAVGLAWVLLEKGWWLETPGQVVVHGVSHQDHGALLAASGLQLPTPLLAVDPSSLQRDLQRLVSPTLQVQVQRTLAPPQLVVSLQHGVAHAWVRRSSADRVERGLLDHRFNWTGFDAQHQGAQHLLDRFPMVKSNVLVLVDFWTPGLPKTLARLFSDLERLETRVNTVRITADGQWVLGTSEVPGEVRLGQPEDLSRKLATMDHLYAQLERKTPPFSYAYVDLRNPEQPKLGLSRGQGAISPIGEDFRWPY